ncbi:hypothetical protein M758_UG127900 [Ceratodon purpureus]|nr:hypothetical protein M758_UG127900 [Ceratodon purpureus]
MESCMRMADVVQIRRPTIHVPDAGGSARAATSPLWASGDTIPVTPNTILQNFTIKLPMGAAVSTEASALIRIAAAEHSPHPSVDTTSNLYRAPKRRPPPRHTNSDLDPLNTSPAPTSVDGVSTQRMTSMEEAQPTVRVPRQHFEVVPLLRITKDPLLANSMCYILHPDKRDTIVAEGRTGGSWKCTSGKFGSLCKDGEQMVQIHKLIVVNLPLIFIEDRQPFTLLDHALVKPSKSSVYVKWQSQLLCKRKKKPIAQQGSVVISAFQLCSCIRIRYR